MTPWRAGRGWAAWLAVAAAWGAPSPLTAQQVETVPADQSVILARADRARVRGDTAAAVRIVEVSDFECPFCEQFYRDSFRTVDSLYVQPGLVSYVWISFPNAKHPRAWPAVEAAFCAGAAGRFWAMHDLLFERQEVWTKAADPNRLFREWAPEIGVDGESFAACLLNDQTAPLQMRDYDTVTRAGITSTPFFVVGDSVAIQGVLPLDSFRATVDSVLAARGLPVP